MDLAFREETRDWLSLIVLNPCALEPFTLKMLTSFTNRRGDRGAIARPQGLDRACLANSIWRRRIGKDEHRVLAEEMARVSHSPATGMGLAMIGQLSRAGHRGTETRTSLKLSLERPNGAKDIPSEQVQTSPAYRPRRSWMAMIIINGQKIWTSGAQYELDVCLVRTDPDAPKHEGISFVVLPLDQPGITVKPIKLISGSSLFLRTR